MLRLSLLVICSGFPLFLPWVNMVCGLHSWHFSFVSSSSFLAMKVENMLKLKEEFDYKSLARRLDIQLDKLIAEHERQQKAFEDEIEKINVEAQNWISEFESNQADALEKEGLKYQKDYMDSIKKLEEQFEKNQQKNGSEKVPVGLREDGSALTSNTEVA
ncbi:hypothetical protein SO802_023293 [Lithocarpus litseifolius]|uniref:Uncharacterized protein n=1 Tax=Lithocarpus litseifolius TaxID=425828 RepID=A0AAW2C5T6_9ROSI